MTIDGVRVDQLCCPTCGEPYALPIVPQPEQADFDVDQVIAPIAAMPSSRYYIRCPNGHKWTLKTLWRVHDHPFDYVLLGDYLGDT